MQENQRRIVGLSRYLIKHVGVVAVQRLSSLIQRIGIAAIGSVTTVPPAIKLPWSAIVTGFMAEAGLAASDAMTAAAIHIDFIGINLPS